MQQYITHFEGDKDDTDDVTHFFEELSIDTILQNSASDNSSAESFVTFFGEMQNTESMTTTSLLANKSFQYQITFKDDTVTPSANLEPYTYNTATDFRYNDSEFKGLLIDSGAAIRSTGGVGQFRALQQLEKSIRLDKNTAGSSNFLFGIGSTTSIGTVNLDTPIGIVIFHIVQVNTPFLLCLADMDRLGVFFNNISNKLIQSSHSYPVICRYGHAFLPWHTSVYSMITDSFDQNPCFLTDVELRRLHCRFGHPSVRRLQRVLERFGHDVESHALEHLTKYCEHCQKHSKSPGRFKFTLREDVNFNYTITVDIMYIDNTPILHVVDEATRFQAAKWLQNISAKYI